MKAPRPVVRAMARGKRHVPAAAWPLLLTLRSSVGDGPLVADPSLQRVLVLAAHPDDESLGCAGTIALLRGAGASVVAVFATDGSATRGSSLPADEVGIRRREEAVAACRALDVSDVRFLGLPDGGLPGCVGALSEALAPIVASVQPDGILLPWHLDGHPDHAAVGAALSAVDLDPAVEMWGYETWTPLPANRIVDITPVIASKEAAIAAHKTAALAFGRWRSIHGLMGQGYAEGFLVLTVPSWREVLA
jgi:LmbE family N-acetylglucosaminyl deacetylase